MKILFVLEYAHAYGGMQHSVILLARNLVKLGESVGVLLPAEGVAAAKYRELGARVFLDPHGEPWRLSAKAPLGCWRSWRRFQGAFVDVLNEFQPHVVHCNNITAAIFVDWSLPRSHSTRKLFTYRGDLLSGISRRVLARALRRCDAVTVTTDFQKDVTERRLGVSPERIVKIPNAVDSRFLNAEATGEASDAVECPITATGLKVGVLGFPNKRKNQELLLRAAYEMRNEDLDVTFFICGQANIPSDVQYLDYLVQLASELGVADVVRFPGYVSPAYAAMRALDIVVSTSRREGFGRTIIEAWAMRRPVIATRSGGPECIIDHGINGELTDRDDPKELAERLTRLLRDPDLRAAYADAGYQKVVSEYREEDVAQRMVDLYDALLTRGRI